MPGARLRADLWVSEYITPWDVYQHGVVRILAHAKTAFQEMSIVETGAYGKALVLDGKWQSCTGDEFIYHESLVQPAMLLHAAARRVLVLGGGEGATVREVLRWKDVERVTMVDIDGEVVDACREHLPEMHQGAFEDPRTQLVVGDALELLGTTDETWDVVISDLSDPIEEGPSFQLFTKETFESMRRVLAPGGILVVQAGPVAPAELSLHARLAKTLGAVFSDVQNYANFTPTYGSPWGFVICRDEPIDRTPDPAEIDRMLAERTSGGLRAIDGAALLALLAGGPRYIRDAISKETQIYTLSEPPRFFGQGTQRQS